MEAAVADAFREEWGRVVATLIRLTGDWDLAEECTQEAFAPGAGALAARRPPAQSRGLADHAARNRAVDRLRRGSVEAAKLREVAAMAKTDAVRRDSPTRTTAASRTTGCA